MSPLGAIIQWLPFYTGPFGGWVGGPGQGKNLAWRGRGPQQLCLQDGQSPVWHLKQYLGLEWGVISNLHETLCECMNVACERTRDLSNRSCVSNGIPQEWGMEGETAARKEGGKKCGVPGGGMGVGGMDRGPALQFHMLLQTPLSPSSMAQPSPAQHGAGALRLPPPGLSSSSTGSVGMDGCPGPAEFTACTWNTYLFPGCKSEIWEWEEGRGEGGESKHRGQQRPPFPKPWPPGCREPCICGTRICRTCICGTLHLWNPASVGPRICGTRICGTPDLWDPGSVGPREGTGCAGGGDS